MTSIFEQVETRGRNWVAEKLPQALALLIPAGLFRWGQLPAPPSHYHRYLILSSRHAEERCRLRCGLIEGIHNFAV
jgi:hypothetical protein